MSGPGGKLVWGAFTLIVKRQGERSGGLLWPPRSALGGGAGGRWGSLQWDGGLQSCPCSNQHVPGEAGQVAYSNSQIGLGRARATRTTAGGGVGIPRGLSLRLFHPRKAQPSSPETPRPRCPPGFRRRLLLPHPHPSPPTATVAILYRQECPARRARPGSDGSPALSSPLQA